MQTRITSCRSIPNSLDSSSGVRWFAIPPAPSLGHEKTRRRRAHRRVSRVPRLSFRRASVGPSRRIIHHAGEYALVRMDGKPPLPAPFEERHLGASRYFVGGSGPPLVLVHGLGGF